MEERLPDPQRRCMERVVDDPQRRAGGVTYSGRAVASDTVRLSTMHAENVSIPRAAKWKARVYVPQYIVQSMRLRSGDVLLEHRKILADRILVHERSQREIAARAEVPGVMMLGDPGATPLRVSLFQSTPLHGNSTSTGAERAHTNGGREKRRRTWT